MEIFGIGALIGLTSILALRILPAIRNAYYTQHRTDDASSYAGNVISGETL